MEKDESQGPVLAAVAAMLGGAAAMHMMLPLPSDVAYFVTSAERILDGGVPYRDILETNPPLAFWISLPPAWLARAMGTGPQPAFVAYVLAILAAVLTLLWRMLRAAGHDPRPLTLAAAAILSLLPGEAFGQREHFTAMLLFPYLTAAALRLEAAPVARAAALAAGGLAGIGIAFKPYFLVFPLGVELCLLMLTRNLSGAYRAETLTMAAVVALYPAAVWLVTPLYFTAVVPLALETYPAFEVGWLALVRQPQALVLAVLLAYALYVAVRSGSRTAAVWLSAAAAGLASYFVQDKGSPYHLLPGFAFAFVAVLTAPRGWARLPGVVLFAGLAMLGAVFFAQLQRNRIARLDLLLAGREARSVMVLSHDIGLSFPYLQYRNIGWASRTGAYWMLPAVVRGLVSPERGQEIVHGAAEMAAADLAAFRPNYVIVDGRSERAPLNGRRIDYAGLFSGDAAFRLAWLSYRLANRLGPLELWERQP